MRVSQVVLSLCLLLTCDDDGKREVLERELLNQILNQILNRTVGDLAKHFEREGELEFLKIRVRVVLRPVELRCQQLQGHAVVEHVEVQYEVVKRLVDENEVVLLVKAGDEREAAGVLGRHVREVDAAPEVAVDHELLEGQPLAVGGHLLHQEDELVLLQDACLQHDVDYFIHKAENSHDARHDKRFFVCRVF